MSSYLSQISWEKILNPPKFTENEVHVWRADLRLNDSQLAWLENILDGEELCRADRFKFPIHRQRFIANRGYLRKILASYLQISPEKIVFEYGSHGKPFLHSQFKTQLTFNNSASNDLALFAITLKDEIGIDVEFENKTLDYRGLVERFFSVEENKIFRQLPEDQQKSAFFYGWVQKEAFVKAMGTGLSFHLNYFAVDLNPEKPAKLIVVKDDSNAARNWHLTAFVPKTNFIACVAVERSIKELKYFKFENDLALDRF